MATAAPKRATLDDLARTDGKAELIGGRIVPLMPSGFQPTLVAGRIFRRLDDHVSAGGLGYALTDGIGYAVAELPSGRESFSPDVSFFQGPPPANRMRFVEGAPALAVEVRSENDYGPSAELAMAAKRADYFAAGTLVVWDVDPEAECVRVYRASEPDRPATYGRGQRAEAEPAVPGWSVDVDEIFG